MRKTSPVASRMPNQRRITFPLHLTLAITIIACHTWNLPLAFTEKETVCLFVFPMTAANNGNRLTAE
jgi:hypothetical protein